MDNNWKLPNQLTMARLLLSIVFFVLLAISNLLPDPDRGLLLAAFVLYIVAGLTDILDGYIARRWNLTSTFGRIADPFADKVIVCGAFILLAGRNFAFPESGPISELERQMPSWLHGGMASGVQAWMVVVIIAREFIISGIRGYSESQGLTFPATSAGKIKMLVQSVTICTVLYQLAFLTHTRWAIILKIVLVWLTVVVTFLSAFGYVARARKVMAGGPR